MYGIKHEYGAESVESEPDAQSTEGSDGSTLARVHVQMF